MAELRRGSASARRAKVVSLVQSELVHSQSELVKLLAKAGFEVTQATASRDLEDIGAFRGRSKDGTAIYQLPQDEAHGLARVISLPSELILSIDSSANMAVVRTPPGGAQLLACALDAARSQGQLTSLIGTVAGDDTVLLISKRSAGGAALAKDLQKISNPMKNSHKKTTNRGSNS